MTSPQLENGYTKIANEIIEALCRTKITGEQRRILDVILRKTYGYNKKEDCISNSQFCEATGLRKQNVYRSLNTLIEMNIVIKDDYSRIPSYRFNKKYKEWKSNHIRLPVIKSDESSNHRRDPQKKVLQKKIFMVPTVEQIRDYCSQRNNNVSPTKFFNFYESKGWMVGKNKMKDWKAAVRTWEQTSDKKESEWR